ncbi:hypothetical protein N0V91_009041 [Didymella pomorum]|uniref:DUF7708 domain-containing protein n=1 Tax=Didymella pomorum TaxID=749634 RepID=A0A9W9D484_9PLEO|nr:hypothetical protein N0V91_009041 [Didymella pomorum]
MCELYAEIHAQVFIFYRNTIAWYMERKRDRFVKSFNEQLKSGYATAVEKINECINALLVEAEVAQIAMQKAIFLGVRGLEREMLRQRQAPPSDIARVGIPMQNLLYTMLYSNSVELVNAEKETEDVLLSASEQPPVIETTPEKAGLIGLVYSLIIQLLQFRVEEDVLRISKEDMEALNGSDESWGIALGMLRSHLRATPQLSACVIDDLNMLALSTGVDWCEELLDVIFEHQQTCAHAFRVLLTTAGHSGIISEYFERDERVFVQRGAQEILRRDLRALELVSNGNR